MKLMKKARKRMMIPFKIRTPPIKTMTIGLKKAGLNHKTPMIPAKRASKNKKAGM